MAVYLISLLLLLVNGDDSLSKNAKADKLRALSYSSGGIISFSSEDFLEYAIRMPRPYTLVVLFTTSSAKYKCTACEEVQQMYEQVVYSYKEAGADQPVSSPDGQKSRAVFFAVMEYSQQTHNIFNKLGFFSVPNLLVTHPRSITEANDKFIIPKEDLWEISPSVEIHAYKVIEFINGRSQRSVELKTSVLDAVLSLTYLLSLIGIVGFAVFKLRTLLMIPVVWFAGGILIYFICMAGVVYDIIHGVPWVGSTSKGEAEYINSGQRSQYGLEGFLMSFMISTAGVALVGVNLAAKMGSTTYVRISGILSLAVLFLSLTRIVGVYRVKASWYNPGMAPPGHYVRGPLIRDQGNSF
jgi:oligosaccharyltransferase complex subunit gamma